MTISTLFGFTVARYNVLAILYIHIAKKIWLHKGRGRLRRIFISHILCMFLSPALVATCTPIKLKNQMWVDEVAYICMPRVGEYCFKYIYISF